MNLAWSADSLLAECPESLSEAARAAAAAPSAGPETIAAPSALVLEGLVRENMGWLQGWLRGRVGDAELVHDLSQEAFLKAFRNFSQLRSRKRFSAWLYATAQNLVRDHLRMKKRRRTTSWTNDDLDVIQAAPERPDALRLAEDAERALVAVRALPERYREPFLLRHTENLSYAEIAEVLGIRPNAVRVRMHRARQMLRAALAAADLDVTDRNATGGAPTEGATLAEDSTVKDVPL